MIFLCRNHWWSKHKSFSWLVEKCIRRHELRRLKNDLSIACQGCSIATHVVAKLRVEDWMRLLPDQQWPNRRGAIAPVCGSHLGPARACIALLFGTVTSAR